MIVPSSRAPALPSPPLRLGFAALTDAAPLIVAAAHGHFQAQGLNVRLSREVGWATVRDKIVFDQLDAAPVPAPMLWAVQLGLGCPAVPVCTAFITSLHGNAITLSQRLLADGVRDVNTLRAVAQRRRGESRLTFGVVFPFSSHHLHLRRWLVPGGIDPQRDIRIVVVPPAQMYRNLAAGTLDGFCAGEPWNSLAVREGAGWCPLWSAALAPGHVEKVLMVRTRFADRRATEHTALLRGLAAAAAWCDEPAHRPELARLLAEPRHLNLPAEVIAPALTGRFDCGLGRIESVPDFHIFHRGHANHPTPARAAELQAELVAAGLVPSLPALSELPRHLFRDDRYREALHQPDDSHAPPESKPRGGALVPA